MHKLASAFKTDTRPIFDKIKPQAPLLVVPFRQFL